MKIVVDQNVPYGAEAFSSAGTVVQLPGRDLRREDLDECEVLIVRSITRVNSELLEGTPVRFVGTCTIGTDHLDIPWLESREIHWCSAPGCNARSVAEWVGGALAVAHLRRKIDLSSIRRTGIIGVGRVGRTVQELFEALGWEVLRNDPPRAEAEGPEGFKSLAEVLAKSQVVCAHLPLTRTGSHSTVGLLGEKLQALDDGTVFLNAGRGGTARTDALATLRAHRPDIFLGLDVFDPEPSFPSALARSCDLVSPHVAGYSYEGKIEGTRMVQNDLAEFLGIEPWTPPDLEPSPIAVGPIGPEESTWDILARLILAAFDPRRDDEALREGLDLDDASRGAHFDRLRKEYPKRLEWRHRPVLDAADLPAAAWEIARRLGFQAG